MQGGLANPVLYRQNVLYATMKITRDLLDRPATHRIFSGGGMTFAILGVERHMDVSRGAIHVTSALSSLSLYPVLGVQEGIRCRLLRHPPLPGMVTGVSVTPTAEQTYVHLWVDILPLLPTLHIRCRGGIEG